MQGFMYSGTRVNDQKIKSVRLCICDSANNCSLPHKDDRNCHSIYTRYKSTLQQITWSPSSRKRTGRSAIFTDTDKIDYESCDIIDGRPGRQFEISPK